VLGHDVTPITTMITNSEGPRIDARTIASGRNGITRNQSVSRIRTTSDFPPKYPATIPITAPIATEMSVAKSPTMSDGRDPHTVSVNTERPKLSVPNGKWRLGGWSGTPVQVHVGSSPSLLAMSGANTATAMKKTRAPRPIIPNRFLRYVAQTRLADIRRRVQAIARGLRGTSGGGVGSTPGGASTS
jgi:hypothetical protein